MKRKILPEHIPELLKVELTREPLRSLPMYSYHIIESVFTCHMWGVVRYGLRREHDTNARALALEAGGAMHKVFSAIRLWQLAHIQHEEEKAQKRGRELFGPVWDKLSMFCKTSPRNEDERSDLLELSFIALHNSGYYDDPRDNIRTISNMETATIRYIDEQLLTMSDWEIYHDDRVTGVEQALDCTLTYKDGTVIRYIGTVDGILRKSYAPSKPLYIAENKTASRLDSAWQLAFETSHQVTGYNVLASTLLDEQVFRSRIFGLKLSPTPTEGYSAIEPTPRNNETIQTWARWVYEGVSLYERYGTDYERAQRLTHSCNRYFRPCALINFCSDTKEGRTQQVEQMVETELSPSEEAIMNREY